MSCRFPGAPDIDAFWQNLRAGAESISFFSDEELLSSGIDPSVLKSPNYVKASAILSGIELFDASFFGFSAREAAMMDPQHRLFLECAWEALERAGYTPETYAGSIGVYAGAGMNTYLPNLFPNRDLSDSAAIYQAIIANDKDFLCTRVSYKLDLKGPSVNVQTACSTSLVAVHLACQSLLSGECDMALAGGVSVRVPQKVGYWSQEGMILSPDGHCRAFDARAQGTVGGNGAGIVVLKRLSEAIADRDDIHAIIKGSAINNDGSLKVGFTAPSRDGQAAVISEAMAVAGIEAETVTFIEAHGTATALGDPIEIAALTQAFRTSTQKKRFCALGSVKTNIGHLDTAAGVAGLIKTVLALRHQMLPPSLHFEHPNPTIDFAKSPFHVNTALTEWETNETPRRAGVSSFGIGGTNAHVVLEEAPRHGSSGTTLPWQLVVLSARTRSALDMATVNLVEHLKQHPDINLADAAYTLQVGRRTFNHRRMLVCRDVDDAVSSLETLNPERVFTHAQEPGERTVAFMFPGKPALHLNMALELYQAEPTFRESVDLSSELLGRHLGIDLRHVLYPSQERAIEAARQLQQTALAKPALFVTEYALARLLMTWGVRPQAMIGYDIGEYVAACLAGVFSLEDALALVAARERLTDPDSEPFTEQVKRVSLKPPQIPYVSNVTGTWITAAQATDPSYWTRHLRQEVRIAESVRPLLQESELVLVEVGPGSTWSTSAMQHPDRAAAQVVLSSLPHAQDHESDVACLLTTLGRLWLANVPIDWFGLHASERRHRLPLPTYPFERQRYWIDPLPQTDKPRAEISPAQALPDKQRDIGDWFYVPSWKRSITPARQPDRMPVGACWLMFIDECGLGSLLVKQLRQQGQDVVTVRPGPEFAKPSDRVFTLNPRRRNDYDALLNELRALGAMPGAIVHLWSVTPDGHEESDLEWFERAQETGFYSLLFLAQALGKQNLTEEFQIAVVSSNLQEVTGEEVLCPERTTILGPVKVIPAEYPHINCRSIDIVLPPAGTSRAQILIDQLLAEFTAEPTDRVIAYRGNHRWVQTFEPVRLEGVTEATPRVREGGVYLITGGLGGIGLALAEHLAKTARAKLILTGRSAFPARDEWETWLSSHDESDDLSRKIRTLQQLEELGAEVLTLRADVVDRQQMQAAISQSLARFGQIHGVIHAAGVAGGGMMQPKRQDMAESVLAPKVRGTLVLNDIFKGVQLDFFVLCSSLSSILGGVGEADYCAANAFLDAFAHYSAASHGLLTVCINWDTWQEVGMAANAVVPLHLQQRKAEWLQRGISPQEGIEAFSRILASTLPQVLVSTYDLLTRVERENAPPASRFWEVSERARLSNPTHRRPQLSRAYTAPRDETERILADMWKKSLGIEPVGIHDDFFELGGDSLLAVRLMSEFRHTFRTELSPHTLLSAPTIAALAELIEKPGMLPQRPSVLVELQAGNHLKHPLFLIHPVGGHVYLYRDLARCLGSDQPVYGLQAHGLEGDTEPLTHVREMATRYIEAIRSLQPEGPWFLGGASFGGTVAFEMAQQLRARDQSVALLVMIDTPGPGHMPSELEDDAEILAYYLSAGADASIPFDSLRKLEPDQQLLYGLEQGGLAHGIMPLMEPGELRHILHLFKMNSQAMRSYVPRGYPGRVIFFRASQRDAFNPPNPERAWIDFAVGGIEIHDVPGNHITMNFPPHVQVLAKRLRDYLDEAQEAITSQG